MSTPAPDDRPLAVPAAGRAPSGRVLTFLGLYLLLLLLPDALVRLDLLGAEGRAWAAAARYAVLAGVGLVLLWPAVPRSLALTRRHPVRTALWVLGAVLAGELAPLLPGVLLSVLDLLPTTGTNEENVGRVSELLPPGVFLVMLAVLGPITEELVFRESLVERTRGRVPVALSLLVSSALFGLLHVHSLAELPLALIYASVGLVYGIALVGTRGNLLVPVLGHGVHNGVPALGVLVG